ncbi:hypothetical protein SCHPADRAFT_172678 [Schizopora paradoxa]|uniref:Uncharacterized protein n=1 Tax=Schizopora paradoxa TaxID=27342 RepID=A0A0H2RYX2_9AGAM|nr:hypothetical protein SCHPADRAFT_172678 [Schizopora paradoxa]
MGWIRRAWGIIIDRFNICFDLLRFFSALRFFCFSVLKIFLFSLSFVVVFFLEPRTLADGLAFLSSFHSFLSVILSSRLPSILLQSPHSSRAHSPNYARSPYYFPYFLLSYYPNQHQTPHQLIVYHLQYIYVFVSAFPLFPPVSFVFLSVLSPSQRPLTHRCCYISIYRIIVYYGILFFSFQVLFSSLAFELCPVDR